MSEQTEDQFPKGAECVVVEASTDAPLTRFAVPAFHPTRIAVRRLGWKALDAATEAQQAEAMRTLTRLIPTGADQSAIRDLVAGAARDGVAKATAARQAAAEDVAAAPATVDAPGAADAPTAAPAAPPAADPLDTYSVPVLLARGVVSLDGVAIAVEALEDLSPGAARRTAAAILRLSAPEAYETEADRGNA